jgi:chaperone modulatory protein CbpM
MIATAELMAHARLDITTVETWVEVGWLRPGQLQEPRFSDLDVARAQLIRELQVDLGVNDEGVAIILDLLDQVHGLRRLTRELVEVIGRQPELHRSTIRATLVSTVLHEKTGA